MSQSGKKTIKDVLLTSKGRAFSMSVICRCSQTAKEAFDDIGIMLVDKISMRNHEVSGDVLYFDDLEVTKSNTELCLRCLIGFCKKHKARSITIMFNEEDVTEFDEDDLPFAIAE